MVGSKGKWSMYIYLSEDISLRPYLLETRMFSPLNLSEMLSKYEHLTIKQVYGIIDYDSFTIDKFNDGHYLVTKNDNKVIRESSNIISFTMLNIDPQKEYIIQEGFCSSYTKYLSNIYFTRNYQENRWSDIKILKHKSNPPYLEDIYTIKNSALEEFNIISHKIATNLKSEHNDYSVFLFNFGIDTAGKVRIADVFMPVRGNKWWQYYFLSNNPELEDCLPETKLFWKSNFFEMISKHKTILIKPYLGYRGSNITQITTLKDNIYELRYENSKILITGLEETFSYLRKNNLVKLGRYIVQQRIPLGEIDNCIFDFRVVLQKNYTEIWKRTGMLARIAYSDYVISNVTKQTLSFEQLAKLGVVNNHLLENIDSVCYKVIRELEAVYDNFNIVGIDIGVDVNGKVWFIEANFNPDFKMFLNLDDKTMYKRMVEYKYNNNTKY